VFACFAMFMRYGHPLWAVPVLFVVTMMVATVVGELVARYFSEPVNRKLRAWWSEGSLGSVSES
jgi:peptidoglycan/LPS O-acetylase OafA/YrhL